MDIKCLVVGDLKENCYILKKNNEILIIDPGDEAEKIIASTTSGKVVGLLVTHHHFDHIGALQTLEKYYNLKANQYNGQTFSYQIINTPGHTKDSLSFYFPKQKIMFVGDFLFLNSIGRTDLGGDNEKMKKSLKLISEYPDEITIYPGHGPKTTLKDEKENFNQYYTWL